MGGLVLVDSCIFIDLIRNRLDPAEELMARLQLTDIVTCGMVRLEVIRGITNPKARKVFEGFFDVMQNVPTDSKLWEDAIEMAWQTQRKGQTLPAQDIIIAASARRVDAAVLTYDKHFGSIPGIRVIGDLDKLI